MRAIKKSIIGYTFTLSAIGTMAIGFVAFLCLFLSATSIMRNQVVDKYVSITELLVSQTDTKVLNEYINHDKHDKVTSGKILEPYLKAKKQIPNIVDITVLYYDKERKRWLIVFDYDHLEKDMNAFHLPSDFVHKLIAAQTSSVNIQKEDAGMGLKTIRVYSPIPNEDKHSVAVLGVKFKTTEKIPWLKDFIIVGIGIALICMLLVIGFSFIIRRKFISPTNELIDQVVQLSNNGNISHLPENAPGEFGQLAKRFNELQDANRSFRKRLEELLNQAIFEKDKIFKIYRDVINAVTQGKVYLASQEEFSSILQENLPLLTLKLNDRQDITKCREEVDTFLKQNSQYWTGKTRLHTLLCLSEATTNVIKHAQKGEVILTLKDNLLTFYIIDQGPGMDLKKLPHMVFFKGFSTKISLGCGFTLMYYYMDRMSLFTSDKGTWLALEVRLEDGKTKG